MQLLNFIHANAYAILACFLMFLAGAVLMMNYTGYTDAPNPELKVLCPVCHHRNEIFKSTLVYDLRHKSGKWTCQRCDYYLTEIIQNTKWYKSVANTLAKEAYAFYNPIKVEKAKEWPPAHYTPEFEKIDACLSKNTPTKETTANLNKLVDALDAGRKTFNTTPPYSVDDLAKEYAKLSDIELVTHSDAIDKAAGMRPNVDAVDKALIKSAKVEVKVKDDPKAMADLNAVISKLDSVLKVSPPMKSYRPHRKNPPK